MVVEHAVAAADNMPGVLDKISAFIATAESAAADGLTWAEFGQLLVSLLRLLVAAIDDVTTMTGEQKKALVMNAAGHLFDAVAVFAVPAWCLPVWVLARPAIRSLVMALASGAIEVILPLVRSATT